MICFYDQLKDLDGVEYIEEEACSSTAMESSPPSTTTGPMVASRAKRTTSTEGTINTRVYCTEVFICASTGEGDNVFWAFFGLGIPITDTDTRYTNVCKQN